MTITFRNTIDFGVDDKEFRDALEKNPHLQFYVKDFIERTGTKPQYIVELSRELRDLKMPNIIYPVGDPIFIHIYSVSEDKRPIYHPIEPSIPDFNFKLIDVIEEAIAYIIDDSYDYSSPKEHEELIKKALRKVTEIDDSISNLGGYRVKEDRFGFKKIYLNKLTYNCLEYYFIKEKVGLGILEPFIRDRYIEDITCNGVGPLFVEHKIFSSLQTTVEFKSEEDLDDYIIKLSERIGRPVAYRKPIVDAVLPDGSRINIVFGKDISQKGSNFTIRKFSEVPLSIIQLCLWNTMSFLEAAYLWMLLENGLSVWVCGETASGKTTTLKALTTFIDPNAKIISIEDTPEVVVPHENWTREVTRETEDKSSSVQMYDLLRAALRQRPNYIIVGEIRGVEGSVAFQAMQSVAYDTPVLIRNLTNHEVRLMSIGELVDKFYRDYEESIPKPVNNLEILSFDRYGRITWSRVKYVFRHEADEMYEIIYEGKGVIKATGSHSVFVLDEASLEIRPKLVSELREGDLLISFIKKREIYNKKYIIDPYSLLKNDHIYSERVPLRPVIKIIKEAGLMKNLPRELTYIIKTFDDKHRLVPRSIARKFLRYIKKNLSSVSAKNREILTRLEILLKSDIALLKVISVKRAKYRGYMYDVSVPDTELFIGGEVPIALHNTGHPVMATFHAASVEKLIQRLTGSPIEIPKTYIDNLNAVIIQSAVRLPKTGKLERRVISINEIIGYDPIDEQFHYIEIFTWEPADDRHEFRGEGMSHLLENKIARMKGIPQREMRRIYEELLMREEILRLLGELGVVNYYDVWRIIKKVRCIGLERSLEKLRRGELL